MRASQLAINSVSTKHKDIVAVIEAYHAAGFPNVEFVLPQVKEWLAAGHSVAELRELLASKGMRSIGGFQTHVDCFGEAEQQAQNHAIHLENVALIHELGGGTLVVGTDGPAQPSVEALDQVAATIRRLAEQIEDKDVRIAIEFNWSPLVKSLHSAVLVAQKVNHPQVGVLFDPAHYYTTVTKFEHLNAETIPWIKHVHLDDMRDKPGELSNCNSDRVLPGQGVIDLPAMIAVLEEHGYDGYYSIEMFNDELWKLPVGEAAQQCYDSLLPLCTQG